MPDLGLPRKESRRVCESVPIDYPQPWYSSRHSGREAFPFGLGLSVSEADIQDAARKIEDGAKAAISGSIHSSFIARSPEGTKAGQSEAKPLYNQ